MTYERSIELYGDGIGKVEYVQHMGSDLTVVNSARVSFGKNKAILDERDEKLISYLIKHRHTSVLEHCSVTFRFIVPLYIRSQHHRHRTWSYNEISRRYTDIDLKFYEPSEFRTQHKSNRQASNAEELIDPPLQLESDISNTPRIIFASKALTDHHLASLQLFDTLIEAGVCREQARGVLPQNLYTQYYGTVNMSNLLKFIDLRTHDGAQWEIQKVAQACLEIATDLWPVTVNAYREIRGEE
jgi:thymidylate synthase (FAD)